MAADAISYNILYQQIISLKNQVIADELSAVFLLFSSLLRVKYAISRCLSVQD